MINAPAGKLPKGCAADGLSGTIGCLSLKEEAAAPLCEEERASAKAIT